VVEQEEVNLLIHLELQVQEVQVVEQQVKEVQDIQVEQEILLQ
jgi:hypothetical protein